MPFHQQALAHLRRESARAGEHEGLRRHGEATLRERTAEDAPNPLLSPPFTAVAGSPGRFRRREKEGGAGAEQSSWRDNYSTTSSILPGRSSPPVFNDGTSSVSTNSVLRSRPEPYQYVRSLIKGKLKNKYIFLLRRVGWCKKFVLNG